MSDAGKIIEGEGGHEYLVRCISIVTLLYERGILQELLETGRLTHEEVDTRARMIQKCYPGFAGLKGDEAGSNGSEEQGRVIDEG